MKERGEFVLPDLHRAYSGRHDEAGFSAILKTAEIAAGPGERISFHSLRHTFITRLAAAGVSQDLRMRLAGHSNAATHEGYNQDQQQARAAIEALS